MSQRVVIWLTAKISVALIGMSSGTNCSMAARPASVVGILQQMLGPISRLASDCRMISAVSSSRIGSPWMLT